jgi:hypothetical protein
MGGHSGVFWNDVGGRWCKACCSSSAQQVIVLLPEMAPEAVLAALQVKQCYTVAQHTPQFQAHIPLT